MTKSVQIFIFIALFSLLTTPVKGESAGQIVRSANIEEICERAPTLTHRRTVVYVDLSDVKENDLEWGLTLLNRLGLGPRETLIVLATDPQTLATKEVFNLCWPKFMPEEIESARGERSFWDQLVSFDPQEQEKENLTVFDNRLKGALDTIVEMSKRVSTDKRKNIIAAISLDKDRLVSGAVSTRVVIFTDGIIKDAGIELNTGTPAEASTKLIAAYPISLKRSDVLMYGINPSQVSDVKNLEKIFRSIFLAGAGFLRTFSFALPQQTAVIYSKRAHANGTYSGGNSKGELEISYATVDDGALADAWLTFSTAGGEAYVPVEGTLRCFDSSCELEARVSANIPEFAKAPFFRNGDKLSLKGSGKKWEGKLESENDSFEGTQETVKYDLVLLEN